MPHIPLTPIESWIHEKIGGESGLLTREALTRYQMGALQATVDFALKNVPFYQKKLAPFSEKRITSPSDLLALPFTEAEDIRRAPLQFIGVSQGEIARAVTLKTSGTTASPKRIFFTEGDLELTVDYFAHAMADFVTPGRRVLIFMPGPQPESIGQLIRRGLGRMGVKGIVAGPVTDPSQAADLINDHEPECLIGIPTQMLQLARREGIRARCQERIKNVILSADYVPCAITRAIETAWNCSVFNHYGMTEMGYAGGVECHAGHGYHFREADLYIEIIDPASGDPVQDGEMGEVVFTTLTRKGMPLIRYRTGDLARFLKGRCPCDTILKRMAPVCGRRHGAVSLKNGALLTLADLDEALFSVPDLLNYHAKITRIREGETLTIAFFSVSSDRESNRHAVHEAVSQIQIIQDALFQGALTLSIEEEQNAPCATTGMIKRTLTDQRESGPLV